MKGTRYARATIHRGSGSDEFSLDGFLSDAREEAPLMVGSRPGMQAGQDVRPQEYGARDGAKTRSAGECWRGEESAKPSKI